MISPSQTQSDSDEAFEDRALREMEAKKMSPYALKANELEVTKSLLILTDKQKVEFILTSVNRSRDYLRGRTSFISSDGMFSKIRVLEEFSNYLLRSKLTLDEADVKQFGEAFIKPRSESHNITSWPIGLLIKQVEKNFPKVENHPAVVDVLQKIRVEIDKSNQRDKDTLKLIDKVDSLLFKAKNQEGAIKPVLFLGEDPFVKHANDVIQRQPEEERLIWYKVVGHCQKAAGSKPSAKYSEQSKALVHELGIEKYKSMVLDWLEFIIKLKESTQEHRNIYNGREYTYTSTEFLASATLDAVKGVVWSCAQFFDTRTLQIVAALAERCFKKIPGKGPAAASVGNACLYTLYKSKGLEGIAHLSRLKLRIKQSSTQTLIEKYLTDAAAAEGVTVAEIEDLAVDDYGLSKGQREYELEGFKAVVKLQALDDVVLEWYKPDGTLQKSVPAVVKEKQAARLKKIKDTIKQIEVAIRAQRDRIDRMLRQERKMNWAYFNKHYYGHGLLSHLTKDILWKLEKGGKTDTCICLNGRWTTVNSTVIEPDDSYQVSLWHPVTSSVAEIRSWRECLMAHKIKQPIKQAYREVYLLTDAEVNTRIYSNRMAAHILKQHQFNSLAKTRGWKYSLLGAYDDGRYNEGAQLDFQEGNLRIEFWVNEVNADDAFNDAGIWNYVATDQVRFVDRVTSEPVALVDVPVVMFSEGMRDVDLFVGVASVGNDPTWRDSGGIPAYRDYWQSYSFGELSEIAKTRKEILVNLLPRLKIASIAEIKDRFLVVKGKKRTYKIHLGSTNILMEPNDQYLCIVPDRSKKDETNPVFLPFEGDTGLSVILSKAFLLAADDKITDTTILTQINRE